MWYCLVMWIPLVVPMIVDLNVEAEVKLTKIKHGNLFKDVGHVYSQAKDAHLIIPIDLKELEDRNNALASIRRSVLAMDENKRIPSNDPRSAPYLFNSKTRRSLQWMKKWTNESITNGLDRLEETLKSFDPNITMIGDLGGRRRRGVTHHDREKRQIVVGTIGVVAGGLIAGLVNKYETDRLVHVLKQRQDVIAHQIEADQIRIHQNAKDLERLNKTVGAVVNAVWKMENLMNNTNYVTMSLMTTYSVTEVVSKSNAIMDALEDARSGTFNINLCETAGLKNGITELQRQGLKHGRSLAVRSLFDLTHLAVSYLIDFVKKKVYLVVHCPLVITNDYMVLYQYQGSALLLTNNTDIYVEIEVDNQYLALTQDNALYNEWTDASLKDCQKLQNVYFCPGTIQYKRSRESCLTGLYDGNNRIVKEQCPLIMTNHVSTVTQLNASTYMLTETTASELVVDCDENRRRYPIKGTYLLSLNPGCVASTRQVVITRPKLEAEVTTKTKFLNNPLDLSDLIDHDKLHQFLELAHNFLGTVGKHVPVKAVTSLLHFQTDYAQANRYTLSQWITSLKPGSLLHTIVIAFILVVVGVICIKCCPCLVRQIQQRRQKARGRERIEMPTRPRNQISDAVRDANNQILIRQGSARYKARTALSPDDTLGQRLICSPPPIGNWSEGHQPEDKKEDGITREEFADIRQSLGNRAYSQSEKQETASKAEELGISEQQLEQLQRMTDDAEFESVCRYPFISMMSVVPIEPEIGLPSPTTTQKHLKTIRKQRKKHLDGLTSTERMDLMHQENALADKYSKSENLRL